METQTQDLDSFTLAYIECALWSSGDDNGVPLDSDHTVSDLAPDTLRKMVSDCARFQEQNVEYIAWDNLRYFPHRYSTQEKAGHDFWLTRNHHGAGFWDGDWTEPSATKLTDAAHAMGEFNLYVGDDSLIYA